MKIASYNIWNHDKDYHERMDLLINILKEEEIGILALQEVRDESIIERIQNECQFTYYYWKLNPNWKEGVAVLSKYPIIDTWMNWDESEDIHNSAMMNLTINVNGVKIGITNVHLDYEKSLNREIEIVKAIRKIEEKEDNDYQLLLGDFNSYPDSIIHHYLLGKQSLQKSSTSWIDLAEAYTLKDGKKPEVTLDFQNNPRWDHDEVLEVPGRFDWILLKNPYPKKSPMIKYFKVLGKERVNGITPSDHYGVLCEMEI